MKRSDFYGRLLLLTILFFAFGLRLYRLGDQSMWWDELKTLERATIPLQDLLADLISKRNHMPLYFLLMHPWVLVGQSAFILRFFSVIWGTLSVAEMYRVGRLVAGRAGGIVAALLLAVAPFHVWYSQEARMYTLLPFALLLAHDFLLQIVRREGEDGRSPSISLWLGYTLAMLVALYVHYFAIFIILAHYTYFAFHFRQMRKVALHWFIAAFVVGAFAAVWGTAVATTSGYSQAAPPWIAKIHWYDPFLTLWNFSAGFSLPLDNFAGTGLCFLYVMALLATLPFLRKQSKNWQASRLIFFWFIAPLFITTLVSLDWALTHQSQFSIYMDRYLVIILPAFLLLVAWGLVTLTQARRRWLPLLIAIILMGTSMAQVSFHVNPEYARDDWAAALAHITQFAEPGDVIAGRGDVSLPLTSYPHADLPYLEFPPSDGDTITPAYDQVMRGRLATLDDNAKRIWLLEVYYSQNAHNFPDARTEQLFYETSVQRQWLEQRLPVRGHWFFPGIRLTLYDLPGL
ncbi:MAG: glycosyltransferase family 39 protein [Ardenticatenaceae bacterium]|nr:glycosyltransferase family 39 protein [Anaerolineales bacterium]MCB8920231.1 glycosyltransferase family 39 protein [Ardenticatenaceae bacterium]MCB8991964.1 glycosyltransferase family 39 protein [Ardenticatenaceae bacterium]MCB9004903.1 glycosyltransferase family 39 protein [Ardenticatenaceae bacterium]